MMTTIQGWALGLALAGAAISVAVYAKDSSKTFFKNKTERILAVRGARMIILLTQYGVAALIVASLTLDAPWLLVLFHSPLSICAGLMIGTLGIGLFLAAKMSLGVNYTPCFNAYVPHGITTSGIYARIRHPIYSANLLLVIAGFLISGSTLVLPILALLVRLYIKSAQQEEAALSAKFPEYSGYMQTSGRFLPRLKI